jgi:hypothetical protein
MYTTREFEMVVRPGWRCERVWMIVVMLARSRAFARTWQGTMIAIVLYHAHLTLHMHAENCVKV